MKNVILSALLCATGILFSCGEDDVCGENGEVGGQCFTVVGENYGIQEIRGSDISFSRENVTIIFQFGPGAHQYEFVVRSNQYDGTYHENNGENYHYETGKSYFGRSLTFNGNVNAPSTGNLIVNFATVDRENGILSGNFSWEGEDTGETTSNLSGTFQNVEVALENQ